MSLCLVPYSWMTLSVRPCSYILHRDCWSPWQVSDRRSGENCVIGHSSGTPSEPERSPASPRPGVKNSTATMPARTMFRQLMYTIWWIKQVLLGQKTTRKEGKKERRKKEREPRGYNKKRQGARADLISASAFVTEHTQNMGICWQEDPHTFRTAFFIYKFTKSVKVTARWFVRNTRN